MRIGYYVYNQHPEEGEMSGEEVEEARYNRVVDISKVIRNILIDKPRITRFDMQFDEPGEILCEKPGVDEMVLEEAIENPFIIRNSDILN